MKPETITDYLPGLYKAVKMAKYEIAFIVTKMHSIALGSNGTICSPRTALFSSRSGHGKVQNGFPRPP